MKSRGRHWDELFSAKEESQLGWYEHDPARTLEMLGRVPGWEGSTVMIPGAGTSVLVDELLARGCRLILNDVSREALDRLRARLGERAGEAVWLCCDISRPLPEDLPPVDLWIDRAVLHFLCEEAEIAGYFENVRHLLRPGGHALFAEFSTRGATQCAGLPIHRYGVEELDRRLGEGFRRIDQFDHTYINPRGEPREYLYALYRRER